MNYINKCSPLTPLGILIMTECSAMCVSIGFNETLTTKRVYSLRNFNTKILDVRVCVSVLVSLSISCGGLNHMQL